MVDSHIHTSKLKAWKDLQKDLDARKYKSNPFEQKYIDLTTSSCVADDLSTKDDFGLEFLSKSIRARTDIISCQVAYLVKEMIDVSENFCEVKEKEDEHKKKKIRSRLEVDDYSNLFFHKSNLNDSFEAKGTPATDSDEICNSSKLLWIEQLARSLEPSVVEDICRPFLNGRQESADSYGSNIESSIEELTINYADYCSADTLISAM